MKKETILFILACLGTAFIGYLLYKTVLWMQ